MDSEEQQIRRLVAAWVAATKGGDVEGVLALMADDAVFLVTGQPPMRKADFAAAVRGQADNDELRLDIASDIQELEVMGDWAFMRQKLTVVVAQGDARPVTRTGHTLTLLQKQDGKWLLRRDANMLAAVEE
jgi:uncharacterized protein (TIGR02246 family)